MPMRRITMDKVREIIRLDEECGLNQRPIARALNISRPTVKEYLDKIKDAELDYNSIKNINDDVLTEIVSDPKKYRSERYDILSQQFDYFAKELKRTGVTLELLWREYREKHPNGYGYSQFCHHFRVWRNSLEITMHMDHKAGDKMFVDFTGKTLPIVNRNTGEITDAEVFVAVLGASQCTYVEATRTQKKEDFIKSNCNAFHYFGGTTKAVVPDCLKSAVTKADKYEPVINPEYADMARHYHTVILPARPNRPKDKALVEGAVRIVYSRIFAPLRNRIFHSIEELNIAIRELLEDYNNKKMQKFKVSRNELFQQIEKDALKPLPANRYEFRKIKKLKVQLNYHILLSEDKHHYSVPHRYRGHRVTVFYTDTNIEIFYKNQRIASHKRNRIPNGYTTVKEHMPQKHQLQSEWNPQRFINWARNTGEHVETVIVNVLMRRQYPEQAYKTCMGILNLTKQYDNEQLDKACEKAVYFNRYSCRGIKNILENKQEDYQVELFKPMPTHSNIRGNQYYNK
jgi:transposase